MAAARANLERLFRPRHVALIGGRDAGMVAGELARIGYRGQVWPVNPNRAEIGGHRSFASIAELPEAPDAAFVAVPRDAAIDAVAALARSGAGGAVVYAAGFGEAGPDGRAAETRLAAAAGPMALVGPNCYGLINYADRVALWPFAQGGAGAARGAAIVTQSGMLSSDLTMAQRSLPLAAMISAGNQAVLSLEDFVAFLADQPEVSAIGLHIEGLRDVARFEQAALAALDQGKPIVALKTGSSRIGSRLTLSHTGSLSGEDALYGALFDRLGIIRVADPAGMIETLKFLTVAGVPTGRRVAGFTCSGCGATMLADRAEALGLDFAEPSAAVATALRLVLPPTATVSNPLDYTTPIWGDPDHTGPVFAAALAEPADVALLVQDYPLPGLDESLNAYCADASAFIAAAKAAGVPAAVCSTLPENLQAATRDRLVGQGVAPMQGLPDALGAIAGAAWHGERRAQIRARGRTPLIAGAPIDARLIDEAAGKAHLVHAGVAVPAGTEVTGATAPSAARRLGFPVALKMISAGLPHKTEAGAVRLGLADTTAVASAVSLIREHVAAIESGAGTDRFLVERMVGPAVAELLVGIRRDPCFGLALTVGSGGIMAELIGDAVTMLLPAPPDDIADALGRLRAARLIDGFRAAPPGDRAALIDTIMRLAAYATKHPEIAEIEINPLFVLPKGVVAADVLMRVAAPAARSVSA